jgi:hypothetical protein
MQTIDTNDLVSGLFEACGEYSAGTEASPVCAACGWLEAEHAPEIAVVRSLPARRRAPVVPNRIAS